MREESESDAPVSFTFDGREIECDANVSVAAALAEVGEFHLRTKGEDDRRGVFCGMGTCQECRVTIDGVYGMRACMTSVTPGMEVRRDRVHRVSSSSAEHQVQEQQAVIEPELLVIGGGAGGLTAAAIAAEAGLDVVLLDERPSKGGQYFKQPAEQSLLPDSLLDDMQIVTGRKLLDRVTRSGAASGELLHDLYR